MSMYRSFFAVLCATACITSPLQAHLLDELNELFISHVWQIVDDGVAQEKIQEDNPQYEKELPSPPEAPEPAKSLVQRKEDIRFDDVVGQADAVRELRSVVQQFRNPERLRMFGAMNKKGILLEGPPGTGKTRLARAAANELGYSFCECSASSFVEVFVGQGAQRIRELFESAHRSAPAVVFIDEVDAIAATDRSEASNNGSQEYRQTLNELLTQMNKVTHESNILVMAATNTIEAVDEAFKAPHRFEIVTVGLPSEQGRRDTVRHYLNRLPLVEVTEQAIEKVVRKTKGFSQAQLQSLINSSAHIAMSDAQAKKVEDVHLLMALKQARDRMKTSIFGSKSLEYDRVSFNDIAGLDEVIQEFEFLVFSLKHPEKLDEFGVTPPKGILLAGKPGTGKTMLVRALANEAHCKVLYASGSSFDSKFMGDGAREVRKLFDKARMISPAIIFIDEIDAISVRTGGQQTVNELLTQMDGFVKENNVIVIGATNILPEVDYRLRREGRFSKILAIDLPNEKQRKSILELYVNRLPRVNTETVPYEKLVLHTKDFSSAGLRNIINDAAMQACKEQAEQVEKEHFEGALNRALKAKRQRR